MLINEKALTHWINHFYGYGSWDSRFWFVGYEDNGGDLPEEVAEKVDYFYEAHPLEDFALCDLREMYKRAKVRSERPKVRAFDNLYEYRFGEESVLHGPWKNLIAFVHGYNDQALPDLLAYQREKFTSPSINSEALIQLYPLPSPHNHAWYYSWLDFRELNFLKSRVSYQEHVYQQRIRTILSNITKHKPVVVLMYGMDNINLLKASVQEFCKDAKFKMVKALPRTTPQHHRVTLDGTTVVITTQIPALRHNRVETGFDWEEFGRKVRLEA